MRSRAQIPWIEIKSSFCSNKLPHGKSIFSDVWKYSTTHSNDLNYKKVNTVCIPSNGIFCATFLKRHHSSFINATMISSDYWSILLFIPARSLVRGYSFPLSTRAWDYVSILYLYVDPTDVYFKWIFFSNAVRVKE